MSWSGDDPGSQWRESLAGDRLYGHAEGISRSVVEAYARDDRTFGGDGPPMVAYRFEDSRATECVALHLNGYRGILQIDGYGAYSKLVRKDGGNDGVLLAGCWSHSRRKFYELHVAKSSKVATETVERMAKLWEIEETVRGQSPEARVAARQAISAAIVKDVSVASAPQPWA